VTKPCNRHMHGHQTWLCDRRGLALQLAMHLLGHRPRVTCECEQGAPAPAAAAACSRLHAIPARQLTAVSVGVTIQVVLVQNQFTMRQSTCLSEGLAVTSTPRSLSLSLSFRCFVPPPTGHGVTAASCHDKSHRLRWSIKTSAVLVVHCTVDSDLEGTCPLPLVRLVSDCIQSRDMSNSLGLRVSMRPGSPGTVVRGALQHGRESHTVWLPRQPSPWQPRPTQPPAPARGQAVS
jgi:hypothetical protein